MNGAEIIDNLREHYTGRGVIQDGVTHAVTGELVKRPGEKERDTREKLEEDVRNVVSQWFFETGWSARAAHGLHEEAVMRWLDRQAAITKAEVLGHPEIADLQCQVAELEEEEGRLRVELADMTLQRDEYRSKLGGAIEESFELRGKVEELTSKLDKLKESRCQPMQDLLDECNELERHVDMLTAECDEFEHIVDMLTGQRDRYREDMLAQTRRVAELQAELHELNSGEELNTLRASVSGLKSTVERQSETISAQCAELARLNERVHGKRQLPKKVKWPRFSDGKLVKIGRDCWQIQFEKDSYRLADSLCGASWTALFGQPVPDEWRESQWRLR